MKSPAYLKEFLKYSSLNVLGMLGLSCYILADTFFISKGLGTNGLTALNLAIPIYSFINGSGLMLGMGGAAKYAIFKGQKNTADADHVFTNTVILAFLFAAFFFVAGILFSGKISKLLGADQEVYTMCKTYLKVILVFAPAFLMNNVLICFVRNDNLPLLSMAAMTGGSFSNIILDYVFIFVFDMGIFGAVLATGFAPVISILILSSAFWKKKICFHLVKCPFSRELTKNIFSSGFPSLVTEVSSGIVIIVFNAIILHLQGNTGVAAYGIIANLSLVMIAIYTGIAQGIQPILSTNYGIGNKKAVKRVLCYALFSLGIISLAVYSCIFLGTAQIVNIFNQEQNPQLKDIAEEGMKIYFASCIFVGFNIILSVYFTSTENYYPAHIISLLRGFLIIIPLAFILSSVGGMTGVWCVFPVTELLVSAISLGFFIFSKQKRFLA